MHRFLAAAAALLFSATYAAAAQPPRPEDEGYRLARRNCAQCHAIGIADNSPNPNAPRLRELEEREGIEQVITALKNGLLTRHPAMPELKLTPDEITALARYLRSIQEMRETERRDPRRVFAR